MEQQKKVRVNSIKYQTETWTRKMGTFNWNGSPEGRSHQESACRGFLIFEILGNVANERYHEDHSASKIVVENDERRSIEKRFY